MKHLQPQVTSQVNAILAASPSFRREGLSEERRLPLESDLME